MALVLPTFSVPVCLNLWAITTKRRLLPPSSTLNTHEQKANGLASLIKMDPPSFVRKAMYSQPEA